MLRAGAFNPAVLGAHERLAFGRFHGLSRNRLGFHFLARRGSQPHQRVIFWETHDPTIRTGYDSDSALRVDKNLLPQLTLPGAGALALQPAVTDAATSRRQLPTSG